MPHDENGRPYEVLENPLGLISRTNVSQVYEAALGKVAEKTGKPVVIGDWDPKRDLNQHVQSELDKHGLKGTETITDPATGRKIPNVFTGPRYYMKLHHQSETKAQGRGLGSYTAEGTPARGGYEGARSKRMAMMDTNAMLSHGALSVLRDSKLIRGQKNQEYWATYMAGDRPSTPPVPQVYTKFIGLLKASGINVERHGTQTHIMPATDKHIDMLSEGRELENAETVDWRNMEPVKGGLFDTRLTGGHGGNRWSHISLHEPMPSPIMEDPIRKLLGLTGKKFEAILSGTEELNGKTGPSALHSALESINVDRSLEQARADIASGKKTKRDEAYRKLGYLKMSKERGIHPKDWFVSKVPVLPPLFRPVSVMQGSRGQLISDANYLYKEVHDANKALKDVSGISDDTSHERLTLYNAFKGVTGLGDPVQPKNRERKVKGMLSQIFGSSPKNSMIQQKLLSTSVDLVGRAVITPNPDLDMDQAAIPEDKAWEIYSPFLVRNLVRRGTPRVQAMQYVKDRHDMARKALVDEMGQRPVIITRAPVLHRYGLMAFYPRLTQDNTLHVNPIVTKSYGADFDGDTSNFHVVASDEAIKEADEKLLPSKNLLSAANFRAGHYAPTQELLGGIYEASKPTDKEKRPVTFATKKDALRAMYAGKINHDTPVEILEH